MDTSTAPSSNLPIELLQLIFRYCAEFEDLRVGLFRTYPAWIVVTHVCSRWRGAALNYSLLWTLINTDKLGKRWIKAFMERSKASLIDVSLRINPDSGKTRHLLNVDEVIALFAECTRLRSLHVSGRIDIVHKLLDTLHIATHIRFLHLHVANQSTPVELPNNLLGGQAPIREMCFASVSFIIAPHWLLRGITHFTSNQRIPLQILLDTLCQMPVLLSFTLERCVLDWKGTDAPRDVQIPMQNLMYLKVDVDAGSPVIFALLHRRLALPNRAKKILRFHRSSDSYSSMHWSHSILAIPPSLRDVIDSTDGSHHVQFSGGITVGNFRLWTGDAGHEEAEFLFELSWEFRVRKFPIFDLPSLCDLLGVKRVRTFRIPVVSLGPNGFNQLWELLKRLSAVEEMELCADAVRGFCSARGARRQETVLPELRSVHMVKTEPTSNVAEMTEEELLRVFRGNPKH